MPSFERTDRISQEVRHALDRIIRTSVKDPRVKGTWSVTRAEVTRDLKYCKVRVSVLENEYRSDLLKALKNASGFIRRELSREVDLRATPQLIFEDDRNMEYAQHIGEILHEDAQRNAGVEDLEDSADDFIEEEASTSESEGEQ